MVKLSRKISMLFLSIILVLSFSGCGLFGNAGTEKEIYKDNLIDYYDEVFTLFVIGEDGYTDESRSAFTAALRSAERAIANAKATQTQVDEALKRLEKAFSELEIRPMEPPEDELIGLLDPSKYTLTFNDEFSGTELDKTKWDMQRGNGSAYGIWAWGNEEAQSYKAENAEVSDGTLKITAKLENDDGMKYTSARIRTYGKFSQAYGRFEAKMKLPAGQGFWPAFWMLPETGGWPRYGEIDIMEARGRILGEYSGAMHFSASGGGHTYIETGRLAVPGAITEFNVYALEWRPGKLEWILNGEVMRTVAQWNSLDGGGTPFNAPFHILLNLAVGGHFDGYRLPNAGSLPGIMEVDYVRAYEFAS